MADGVLKGKRLCVAINFDAEILADINKLLVKEDRSFSSMVRILVKEALQHRRKAPANA